MGNPLEVYNSIKSACYHGNLTPHQAQKMQGDIAALDLMGKSMMGGGGLGIGFAYVISGIPFIGPLAALVTGVAGTAIIIIGYDTHVAADNLKNYANHRFSNFAKNTANTVIAAFTGVESPSEEKFAIELFNKATQNTIVIGSVYKTIIAQKQ